MRASNQLADGAAVFSFLNQRNNQKQTMRVNCALRRISAFGVLALWSSMSIAAPCEIKGIWSGHVDDIPVTFELQHDIGRYYIKNSFEDILLTQSLDQIHVWDEFDEKDKKVGQLVFECAEGKLSGIWTKLDTNNKTSVRAQKIDDYSETRNEKARFIVLKAQRIGARIIDTVTAAGFKKIEALQIRNPSAMEKSVNQTMRTTLLIHLANHLSCINLGRRFIGADGEEHKVTLITWKGAILSTRDSFTGFCGGPHPYDGEVNSVFNTVSGEALALSSWVSEKNISLDSPLGKLIKQKVLGGKKNIENLPESEQDCAVAALNETPRVSSIESSGIGFDFYFPYLESMCRKNYVLSWNQVKPFLSKLGKQNLALMSCAH